MDSGDFIGEAHTSAVAWANELLARDPLTWVILDTETTGLDDRDEVIQIGVIDGGGSVLMNNQLVKPTCTITAVAHSIHGITLEMLDDAPSFGEVMFDLQMVVKGKLLVIYNAEYDLRMIRQSGQAHGININLSVEGVTCAMEEYAKWTGEWSEYKGAFRWQRLPLGDHTALGDCRSVLQLIKRMARKEGD